MWRTLSCSIWLIVALGITHGVQAGILDDPALVLYYSFDDFTTVVADGSGKGHDGTVQGDVKPFSDQGHRAAKFGGTTGPLGFGYLDLDGANFPAEDIPTAAITLAAWVKCDNTGNHHAIFNARANDATWVIHPEVRSENNYRWLLRAAGSAMLFDIRAGTVAWGEWAHYAGTYDKASGKTILYINKQVVSEQTVPGAKDIAGDWGKGARVAINVDNARPLTGLMDELYLFKRALSKAELDEVTKIARQLKAYAPSPADGTTHLLIPLLQWSAGETAVMHKVYIGTSLELGEADLAGSPVGPPMYFHGPGFTPGTTYFWRVDEVEADGVTVHEGDVWSFTVTSLQASAPNPRNGAKWVNVDADLAWAVGVGAISHDIYFGTDRTAVEAGDAAIFKGNQMGPVYEPGVLAADTQYFWRVDEHAADGALHQGDVWTFRTAGPGLGVKAQYFRGVELAGVPVLTQIEDSINHNWAEGVVAVDLSDNVSARWTANLEAPFTESYQLITTSDDGVRLWLDGRLLIDNWRSHGSTDDIVKTDLVAGQVYLLQMDWYDGTGSAIARLWWQCPSIRREIIPAGPLQLPVRATAPYPANTAVNAVQAPVLHWHAGEQATSHDVYFGDSAEAVAGATTATTGVYQGRQALGETTFDPGVLGWNKTYYWRVDEVNATEADSPWQGSIWSFTTADFLVVDDFESYTDEEGKGTRIYETWLDGWATKDNGSTVGNWDPPFAEQKIVHSGVQSMPMDYNNLDAPYYSEAQCPFEPAQDWTVNGITILVLHVRGVAKNGPAQLYVAVEDKAGHTGVVNHPDSAPVTATQWAEWKIPLADFQAAGVNVNTVKKMYIGVDNRNKPTPGGAGRIYVDGIWVIKP